MKNRRSIRLKGYDYSQEGLYFITICTDEHVCYFGEIENQEMRLNDNGIFAKQCWEAIPAHFPNVVLHEYVVMPNHVHGILEIVGANNDSPKNPPNNTPPRPKGTSKTIGSIVRGFKIGVTKLMGISIWQRNYYEHIIRDWNAYINISEYIINNPKKWKDDRFYIKKYDDENTNKK